MSVNQNSVSTNFTLLVTKNGLRVHIPVHAHTAGVTYSREENQSRNQLQDLQEQQVEQALFPDQTGRTLAVNKHVLR